MNFLLAKEIADFTEYLETEPNISAIAINLWYGLKALANKKPWRMEFVAPISEIKAVTKMSRASIYRARKEIKELGLIDFKESGNNGSAIYKFIRFESHRETQKTQKIGLMSHTETQKSGLVSHTETQTERLKQFERQIHKPQFENNSEADKKYPQFAGFI